MVNRREFLAAAVVTPSVSKLAESALSSGRAGAAGSPLSSLPPGSVKLGGEMGRRIDVTINHNLLALDAEKDFLQPLRDRRAPDGYIGLGKLIDASVRFSVSTRNERLLAFKQRLVAEVLKTQEPDGYIGYLQPEKRVWTLWDISEIGYIVYGLSMDHRYCGEAASLEAARKLADYLVARWNASPAHAIGDNSITVQMPLVGLDNAMLALHGETADQKYVDFIRAYRRSVGWDDRIVRGRWGKVEGHAYTYLAASVGMMRLDRLAPDPQLLQPTHQLLDFLLNRNGMTITGAVGDHECWHDTQEGTINLGETCATTYMLFWLDELMRREGKALYGDLMERVILNTLFGAQSPEGRHLRYYTAFDGPRHYFPTDTYCCPCNYRRAIATLPDLVYYRMENGVAVNLYTESTADVALEGGLKLKLRQETNYPASGQVALHIDPARAAHFPLRLRLPAWCNNPRVTINGQAAESLPAAGQFLVLLREWKPGDQVQLDLPMSPRWVKGRQSQLGHVALMHGPQLFCLNRARHSELKDLDLRLVVFDPQTLEGPFPDSSVRPGGSAFRIKAWKPGSWYPLVKHELDLTLTEFPDPDGEATFLKVPNPNDAAFVADEVLAPGEKS
jgi:hypothetical protein